MNLLQARQRLNLLEERYFEMHKIARAARAELGMRRRRCGCDYRLIDAARTQLDEAEREKRAILSELKLLDDGLLD